MRHRPWTALAPLLLACGQIFTITVEETATAVIPEATLIEEVVDDLGFGDFLEMDIAEAEELQDQGVEEGDIEEAALVSLVLVAMEGSPDLSFIDSLEIFVEGEGLPRQRVAWAEELPEGQSEVALELDEVDLAPYIIGGDMTLTTEARGRRPEQERVVEAQAAIDVGVTAQGCRSAAGR
jgi:hypothetical protein